MTTNTQKPVWQSPYEIVNELLKTGVRYTERSRQKDRDEEKRVPSYILR